MNMTDTRTTDQALQNILSQGDENSARAYIQEHFSEFPEELQQEIVVALADEGLQRQIQEGEAAVKFNKEVLQALAIWQANRSSSGPSQS